MDISENGVYCPFNVLIYSNGHDIIKKLDDHKEESNDHYAGGILHGEGACTEATCNATNRYQLAQQRYYPIVQGRAGMACESYRLREVHGKSAQRTRTKIASWEVQNAKSPLPNSFADSLDNGPGTTKQVFSTCMYPFVFIVQRFVVICNDLTRFTVEQGGKCDVS